MEAAPRQVPGPLRTTVLTTSLPWAAAGGTITGSGKGDAWKSVSQQQSCVSVSRERSCRAPPGLAGPGPAAAGWELKGITVLWSGEVRGGVRSGKWRCLAQTISS